MLSTSFSLSTLLDVLPSLTVRPLVMSKSTDDLRSQWANPGDILSILLLIGGDIV